MTGDQPTLLMRTPLRQSSKTIKLTRQFKIPRPVTYCILFCQRLTGIDEGCYGHLCLISWLVLSNVIRQEQENSGAYSRWSCPVGRYLAPNHLTLENVVMFTSQIKCLTKRPLRFCSKSSLKSRVTAKVNGGLQESVTDRLVTALNCQFFKNALPFSTCWQSRHV